MGDGFSAFAHSPASNSYSYFCFPFRRFERVASGSFAPISAQPSRSSPQGPRSFTRQQERAHHRVASSYHSGRIEVILDDLLDTIARNLRQGIGAAAEKAGELTRVARARLDIASTQKQIYHTQADLGAFVHQHADHSDLANHPQVQLSVRELDGLQRELARREAALVELQRQLSERADGENI